MNTKQRKKLIADKLNELCLEFTAWAEKNGVLLPGQRVRRLAASFEEEQAPRRPGAQLTKTRLRALALVPVEIFEKVAERYMKILRSYGIWNLAQVVVGSDRFLRCLPGMGEKGLRQIGEELEVRSLTFRGPRALQTIEDAERPQFSSEPLGEKDWANILMLPWGRQQRDWLRHMQTHKAGRAIMQYDPKFFPGVSAEIMNAGLISQGLPFRIHVEKVAYGYDLTIGEVRQ